MLLGTEWIVDATGCSATALGDERVLRSLCERIIADLNLTVVGAAQWHPFPGAGGITGLYLLSESHLACHTYPEYESGTFNLYCCRERAAWDWDRALRETLQARWVRVRCVPRGGADARMCTAELAPRAMQ